MFAPTKTWRRWHRKVAVNQRRYAVASALAASALPSLVFARGHRVENVDCLPLVIANEIESCSSTKNAIAILKSINAYADVERVKNSKKLRAGKGKMRNRRTRQRRGPLVVYNTDSGITKAFRNIPGVELCRVSALNLLTLAPGGHLGRFVIWTEDAFKQLDVLYGAIGEVSSSKAGYTLPTACISNPDISRVINSEEVQSVIRAAGPKIQESAAIKRNPLRNLSVMKRLNPYVLRAREIESKQKKSKSGKTRASPAFIASLTQN